MTQEKKFPPSPDSSPSFPPTRREPASISSVEPAKLLCGPSSDPDAFESSNFGLPAYKALTNSPKGSTFHQGDLKYQGLLDIALSLPSAASNISEKLQPPPLNDTAVSVTENGNVEILYSRCPECRVRSVLVPLQAYRVARASDWQGALPNFGSQISLHRCLCRQCQSNLYIYVSDDILGHNILLKEFDALVQASVGQSGVACHAVPYKRLVNVHEYFEIPGFILGGACDDEPNVDLNDKFTLFQTKIPVDPQSVVVMAAQQCSVTVERTDGRKLGTPVKRAVMPLNLQM